MSLPKQVYKNAHLAISALLILVIAVIYGFMPEKIVPSLTIVKSHPDTGNAFKAIMGLYGGMAAFWAMGIRRPPLWQAATLSNIFFMLGLFLGRIISIATDGLPDQNMLGGLILEFLLGVWGILSLRTYKDSSGY